MNTDNDAKIDAALFDLSRECARPSRRFRRLFGSRERSLLGYAIFMTALDRRFGPNVGGQNEQPFNKPA